MPHPAMFTPDDPFLARLRPICLDLPGAAEKISHGHPNFYTAKVFATFGGMVKGDHDSDRFSQSVLVLPDPQERTLLLEDNRFFVPGYSGPSGWIGLDFRAAPPDWNEVAELIDASYRNTAGSRLIAELEARTG